MTDQHNQEQGDDQTPIGTTWPPPLSLPNPTPAPKEPMLERIWVLLLTSMGCDFVVGGLNLLTQHFSHRPFHWREGFDPALILTIIIILFYLWMRSERRKYRSRNA
ncbi:MAG: hypothetical protein ACRYFS_02285 [Janthinobacterium lividum]